MQVTFGTGPNLRCNLRQRLYNCHRVPPFQHSAYIVCSFYSSCYSCPNGDWCLPTPSPDITIAHQGSSRVIKGHRSAFTHCSSRYMSAPERSPFRHYHLFGTTPSFLVLAVRTAQMLHPLSCGESST